MSQRFFFSSFFSFFFLILIILYSRPLPGGFGAGTWLAPCILFMSINCWWKRVFWFKIESHFGNMPTFSGQQKFLKLVATLAENETQHNQTKDYPWLPFVYLLEPCKNFCLVYFLPLFSFPFSWDSISGVSCMHRDQVDDSWL